MPRACPACGRPNSDQAIRCLYCTEPFGAEDEVELSSTPPIPTSERHLIILAPQRDGTAESKIGSVSEVLGLTLYDARLALSTNRYRLLRKVEDREEAEEISRRLEQVGVDHVELAEGDIDALPIRSIEWLRFRSDHMEMHLAGEGAAAMSYQEVLLLVRGEITRARHSERRMATPRGASQPLTPGLRVVLFEKTSKFAAELDAEQFDWSAMEEQQSSSTPMNFKRLIDEILQRSTGARLDRGFDLEPVVLSRSGLESGVDALLDSSKTREGVVYDNGAQFRFYARWRYLVAREAASK